MIRCPQVAKTKRSQAKVLKPKKGCCKSAPRCKRCPVVCKRLAKAGAAVKRDDGRYELAVTVRKKQIREARAR